MAKKTPATPKSKSAAKPASSGSSPTLDTANAAQSAAALLAARAKKALPSAQASKPESSAFKQLKAGLNQTQYAATSPLAGITQSSKQTTGGGFSQQVGHAQTTNANAARTGVPRRTSSG